MKIYRILFLLFFVFVLTACGHSEYSTKKGSYLKESATMHSIVVPRGAMAIEQKPYYSVPNKSVSITGEAPSMKPPGLQ